MQLQAWLEKATMASADLVGPTYGGLLSPGQAAAFLRIAITPTVILSEARIETNNMPKFEVPRISFGDRILRPGVQGTRLADGDRVKGLTGLAELSTALFRGEVPISDEVFEDNIERDSFADTIMTMVAEAVGRDAEEIAIKSDVARAPLGADVADTSSATFDQLDGIIKNFQTDLPGGQKINAAAITSYDALWTAMITALPAQYRRNYAGLRFYVPVEHRDGYQAELAARGTGLGDTAVVDGMRANLAFRGIPIVEVPLLSGATTINGGAVDYAKFAILTDPKNIIVGFQRRIRIERFRDPRDGATSFLPSVRFDTVNADPNYGVLGYGIAL